jgi:hypothetical protein
MEHWLVVDFRNQGTEELATSLPRSLEIEVDGRWYRHRPVETGMFEPRTTLAGGQEHVGYRIPLTLPWRSKDSPLDSLEVKGKHAIRVALSGTIGQQGEEVRATSNSLEFGWPGGPDKQPTSGPAGPVHNEDMSAYLKREGRPGDSK